MSTLEWRRDQPRVEPPICWDWFRIVCEGLSWGGIVASTYLFIGLGDWFFLAHALLFGHVIVREFH